MENFVSSGDPVPNHLFDSAGDRRQPTDFIIPGLDVPTVAEARRIVNQLDGVCDTFKVGKHFILDPEWSNFIHQDIFESARTIMLDFKDFDIGKSAQAFAKQIYYHPSIVFFTVHAVPEEIDAVLKERHIGPSLLAVTLLTSFGPAELLDMYNWDRPVLDFVLERAEMALNRGCEGLVCSPAEVRPLRERFFGWDFDLVVPGCRSPGHASDDHKRVGTPAQAVFDGADYVVMSTPFIEADPYDAFMEVADQISKVI